MYKLEFLPLARQDMIDAVRYISRELQNPQAARLAEALVEAGEAIAEMPWAGPVWVPPRPLDREYRKRLVKNHLMFYWVDEAEKTVTVARVIYARRDSARLLPP